MAFWIAVVGLATGFVCSGCSSQVSPDAGLPWGPVGEGLQAQVSLLKSSFAVGENITVTFRIKNVSDRAIRLPKRLQFFYSNTHLQFQSEPDTGLIGQGEFIRSDDDLLVLQPGQVYTFPHAPKALELERHTQRPGPYAFWYDASFYRTFCPGNARAKDLWSGLLTSNKIRFTLTDKKGAHPVTAAGRPYSRRIGGQAPSWHRSDNAAEAVSKAFTTQLR